jgi:hypothetical protein
MRDRIARIAKRRQQRDDVVIEPFAPHHQGNTRRVGRNRLGRNASRCLSERNRLVGGEERLARRQHRLRTDREQVGGQPPDVPATRRPR